MITQIFKDKFQGPKHAGSCVVAEPKLLSYRETPKYVGQNDVVLIPNKMPPALCRTIQEVTNNLLSCTVTTILLHSCIRHGWLYYLFPSDNSNARLIINQFQSSADTGCNYIRYYQKLKQCHQSNRKNVICFFSDINYTDSLHTTSVCIWID